MMVCTNSRVLLLMSIMNGRIRIRSHCIGTILDIIPQVLVGQLKEKEMI